MICTVVYFQLKDFQAAEFSKNLNFSLLYLLKIALAVGMVTVNVGLEAYKWYVLVRPVHASFSRKDSVRGTLLGMTAAIITPGRIGEYVGRLWAIPKELHTTGLFLAFVARFGQLVITIWGVIVAFFFLNHQNKLPSQLLFLFQIVPEWLLILLSVLIALVYTVILLRPDFFLHKLYFLGKKYQDFAQTIEAVPKYVYLINFWVSLLRYQVFLLQYWLLFSEWEELSTVVLCSFISLMFFVKSVIPSLAIAELGIRGSIALWILGTAGIAPGITLTITGLIYVINQILPAIAGWVIGIQLKKYA